MFLSILYRSILWELIKVFCLSLFVITSLILMAGIVVELSRFGLSAGQILAAIPLIVPSLLPFTIPATTLLATCIVYGRLSHDNEILAIKAAGINIAKVVGPGILLGLAMSATTLALYYHLIPYTQHLLRTMAMKNVEDYLYGMLRRDLCISDPRLEYAMWAQQVHGKRLQKVLFKRREKATGNILLWADAREAYLSVDAPNQLVKVHMRFVNVYTENGKDQIFHADLDWDLPLSDKFAGNEPPKPRAMDWRQLLERRQEILRKIPEVAGQIDQVAELRRSQPSDHANRLFDNLNFQQERNQIELRSVNTELQMRPALCMGCLCFVLVGCPVGIWFSKSDYLSAFITCFLPIVFLYYPLVLCGTNMAKAGRLHPALDLWAANVLMAAIAAALFRKLMRN